MTNAWKDIEFIYKELSEIGRKFNMQTDIIGSYATGLWTPSSDIDIVYTNLDSSSINIESALARIYEIIFKNARVYRIK